MKKGNEIERLMAGIWLRDSQTRILKLYSIFTNYNLCPIKFLIAKHHKQIYFLRFFVFLKC